MSRFVHANPSIEERSGKTAFPLRRAGLVMPWFLRDTKATPSITATAASHYKALIPVPAIYQFLGVTLLRDELGAFKKVLIGFGLSA
jgi:hypothetical protein